MEQNIIYDNVVKIEMDSKSQNESFARVCVSAFVATLDPLVCDVIDIKTAVSEAVTNAIIHGYENKRGKIHLTLMLLDDLVTIEISDNGGGIDNIEQAREPLYTSKPDMERSGMGFTVMESFMDEVAIHSQKGQGTTIILKKRLSQRD